MSKISAPRREQDISTKRFRVLASEVCSLLNYEASADLETEKVTIEGWNGPVEIDQIKGKKITVVPILRAGLGMMDGVLENVPSARISVVGMYRNEETLEPVPYFQKLVSNIDERMALIVDPMLATGGSVIATIDLDTTPINNDHWFALTTLYTPRFEWIAILTILPAALVVIAELVGHLVVTYNFV